MFDTACVVAIVCALLGGLAIGGASAWALFEQSFRLAARYQKTGNAEPPATQQLREGRLSSNPEAAAHAQITQASIKRGADAIQASASEQGLSMSRKDAEAQAARMLQAGGPLGGVS